MRHHQAAANLSGRHGHEFVIKPARALAGITPQLVEDRNRRMTAGSRGEVGSQRANSGTGGGKGDAVARDLGIAPQEWAGLDNAADHLEHTTLRLFEVVGDAIALGVAAAVKQQNGDHEEGSKTGLARLFDRAVDQFGIEQPAVGIGGQRVLEEFPLGGKQLEGFTRFGIDKMALNEYRRVTLPASTIGGVAHGTFSWVPLSHQIPPSRGGLPISNRGIRPWSARRPSGGAVGPRHRANDAGWLRRVGTSPGPARSPRQPSQIALPSSPTRPSA